MNPLSLGLSVPALTYLASVAAASLLVTATALLALRSWQRSPLPLQHSVLVGSVVATLASPLVLALMLASGIALFQLPADGRAPTDSLAPHDFAKPGAADITRSVPPETPVQSPPLAAAATNAVIPAPIKNAASADTNAAELPPHPAFDWSPHRIAQGLAILWGVGCAASLFQLAGGLVRVRRLASECQPVTDRRAHQMLEKVAAHLNLPHLPAIVESAAITAPFSMGLLRPLIVLPSDEIAALSNGQLRGLLTHAMAHIVRRDHLVGLLQRLSLVAYWWNPLVRKVSGEISAVREQICDDWATAKAATGEASSGETYASMLVELAGRAVVGRSLPATIGMFDGSRREFSRRVERLLDESRNVATTLDLRMKFVAAMTAAALVALSGIASIQYESSAAEPPTAPKSVDVKPTKESSDPPAVKWPKELWGVINDEVGRPIVGAKVRLELEKIHEYQIGRWDETVWSREFVTGKDGVYRFDTGEFPEMKHRPFCLTMSVTADGYSESKIWNWYSRNDSKVDQHWLDMKLLPGRVVRGRVLDSNGTPLPGAMVKAAGYFGPNDLGRAWGWDPRKTDEDGRFSIAVPSDEEVPVELWVVSSNWAPQRVAVPKRGDELADVRLQPGGRVSGTVTHEDGSPVAGTVVVAESVDDGTLQDMGFAVHRAVKTDAQGHYQLPPIDGIYRVYLSQSEETDDRLTNRFVVADGPLPLVSPARVAVSGHKDEQLDFHAGPTLAVRGTVRWADGSPVAECQVQASFMPPGFGGGIWLDDTRTDPEGNYTVKLPKPIDAITICVWGAHDANRVWHSAMPAEHTQAEQKSEQSAQLGRLEGDVEDIDWVLESDQEVNDVQPATPKPKDAAVLELEKLERRYVLRQQEYREAEAKATTLDEHAKLLSRDPRVLMADDYLAFEERHRGQDAGLAALQKLNQMSATVSDLMPKLPEARSEMYRRLIAHYLSHPDLDLMFRGTAAGPSTAEGPDLLRKSAAESPHANVKAAAIYQLACYEADLADNAELVGVMTKEFAAEKPQVPGRMEMLAKAAESLRGVDSAAARKRAVELAKRIEREFSDVREPERVFQFNGMFQRQPERSAIPADRKPTYGELAKGFLFDLERLQVGMPAPDVITEKDGKPVYATQYLGKVTMLVFDYSYNEPLEQRITEWAKQHAGKPLDVLLVQTRVRGDTSEPKQNTAAPLRILEEAESGPIATAWGIRRWPTIFLVDREGTIRARKLGIVPTQLINDLLKGAGAEANPELN